jgi:hypothetical protein
MELLAGNEAVYGALRVCLENTDGAYNCGRCIKCLLTMTTLEALGILDKVETFDVPLSLDLLASIDSVSDFGRHRARHYIDWLKRVNADRCLIEAFETSLEGRAPARVSDLGLDWIPHR